MVLFQQDLDPLKRLVGQANSVAPLRRFPINVADRGGYFVLRCILSCRVWPIVDETNDFGTAVYCPRHSRMAATSSVIEAAVIRLLCAYVVPKSIPTTISELLELISLASLFLSSDEGCYNGRRRDLKGGQRTASRKEIAKGKNV